MFVDKEYLFYSCVKENTRESESEKLSEKTVEPTPVEHLVFKERIHTFAFLLYLLYYFHLIYFLFFSWILL